MSDGYGRKLRVGLLGLVVSLLIVAGLASIAAAESIIVQDTLDVDDYDED